MLQSGAEFLVGPVNAGMIVEAVEWTVEPKQYDEKKLRWSFEHLTPREKQVLEYVIQGKSTAQIAVEFGVNKKTVEAYRSSLSAKTMATDAGERMRMRKA